MEKRHTIKSMKIICLKNLYVYGIIMNLYIYFCICFTFVFVYSFNAMYVISKYYNVLNGIINLIVIVCSVCMFM